MIDYKNSIKNLLKNITQEQVDIFFENQKENSLPVETFVSKFNDFSKEGLISLLLAFSMSPKRNDAEGIQKSEEEKISLYHKLGWKYLYNCIYEGRFLTRMIYKKENYKAI